MQRHANATAAFLGVALLTTVSAVAYAADRSNENTAGGQVIVIDATDLFKVSESVSGPRLSSLLDKDVYSNTGKRIGDIEDFVIGKDGMTYAVLDTSDGPVDKLVGLVKDDMVIVPLRELRRESLPGK